MLKLRLYTVIEPERVFTICSVPKIHIWISLSYELICSYYFFSEIYHLVNHAPAHLPKIDELL